MSQEALWNKFYQVVGGEPQVKSLRQIVAYLLKLIDNPLTSAKDLARIIAADPALATTVLTVVNSSAVGLRTQVSDLKYAISLLGYNQLRDIVVNISIIEKVEKSQEAHMTRLWKHSFLCGRVSEIIAQSLGRLSGEAFTVGLLHDIGKILLCYSNAPAFSATLNNYKYQQGRVQHCQVEHQTIGFTHAQIGGLAAMCWKLPDLFHKVIWGHHSPPAVAPSNESDYLAQVIHMADRLCWTFGFPSVNTVNPFFGKKPEECVTEELRSAVGLTKPRFDALVSEVRDALQKSQTIFDWIAGHKAGS